MAEFEASAVTSRVQEKLPHAGKFHLSIQSGEVARRSAQALPEQVFEHVVPRHAASIAFRRTSPMLPRPKYSKPLIAVWISSALKDSTACSTPPFMTSPCTSKTA